MRLEKEREEHVSSDEIPWLEAVGAFHMHEKPGGLGGWDVSQMVQETVCLFEWPVEAYLCAVCSWLLNQQEVNYLKISYDTNKKKTLWPHRQRWRLACSLADVILMSMLMCYVILVLYVLFQIDCVEACLVVCRVRGWSMFAVVRVVGNRQITEPCRSDQWNRGLGRESEMSPTLSA